MFLQTSKNAVIRDIGKGMKTPCTFNNCWKKLKYQAGKYALIEMQNWLEYCIKYYDLPYYLPPMSGASVVFLDFISMGIHKNFEYKEDFNQM